MASLYTFIEVKLPGATIQLESENASKLLAAVFKKSMNLSKKINMIVLGSEWFYV